MSEFELATLEFQQATIAFQQASLEIAGRVNIPAYIAAIGIWFGIAVMYISNRNRARDAKEQHRSNNQRHKEMMDSNNKRHEEVMEALRQERELSMELIRRTSGPPSPPPAAGKDNE